MRTPLRTAAILCACTAGHASITADLPQAWPADRYAQMVKKSPFALATPVAPPATPSFAASLYVSGIAKIGNCDFVTVASRDASQGKFSLTTGEEGQNGISLVSVQWSDQIGKSKVTIKKGNEFSVLEFDQAALRAPVPVTPSMPQLPMPIPPPPGGVHQPSGDARVILPAPPNAPGGGGVRRRIRIINNKPQ